MTRYFRHLEGLYALAKWELQVGMQMMSAMIICAVRKDGVPTFSRGLNPLNLLFAEEEGKHAIRTLTHAAS